jgi:transcriptional regulator with XRE-family HTH domain
MNPFGTYLESLRRSRRMKQCDLAKEIGVNPSYVSAIEGGTKAPPSTPIIQAIVEVLGLSKKEEELLWEYAEQSIRVLRIPEDLPLQEYAVVKSLKNAFGSLSEDQITIICTALAMNKNQQEKVHR